MTSWKKDKVKNILQNKLKIEFRCGNEFNGWFEYKNIKILRVTIPKGRKELKKGTLKAIRNSLKLDSTNFVNLMHCPLRLEGFIQILKTKGSIQT